MRILARARECFSCFCSDFFWIFSIFTEYSYACITQESRQDGPNGPYRPCCASELVLLRSSILLSHWAQLNSVKCLSVDVEWVESHSQTKTGHIRGANACLRNGHSVFNSADIHHRKVTISIVGMCRLVPRMTATHHTTKATIYCCISRVMLFNFTIHSLFGPHRMTWYSGWHRFHDRTTNQSDVVRSIKDKSKTD